MRGLRVQSFDVGLSALWVWGCEGVSIGLRLRDPEYIYKLQGQLEASTTDPRNANTVSGLEVFFVGMFRRR